MAHATRTTGYDPGMATTTTPIDTNRLRSIIAQELPSLVDIRRDLHAHPELGYEETRTSGVVQRELEAAGVDFARNLAGGTGVLGHLPGAAGRAIGLRADMDALPIVESTGLPYASTCAGRMHACGHDGHTTILIGAARVLARIADDHALPRPVTFLFQPAEEGGGGGKRMVEDGCLTGNVIGPPVERMFGLHGWPRFPLGVVGTRPGPLLAAADMFELVVRGVGGHAAFPHMGRDPVVAACATVGALQQIASRNTDPLDSVVVSATTIHAGTLHNIIPDEVRLSGTVRTLRDATRTATIERLNAIVRHTAEAHGCTADLEYIEGYPVTDNDPAAADFVRTVAIDAFGAERFVGVPAPFMGAEDFSFYCREVPSCFFVLGLLPPDRDAMADLHQAGFDFTDDAIATGVEMFCRLALRS